MLDTVEGLLRLATPPAEIVLADQTARHDAAAERALRDWHEGGRVRWLRLGQPSIPAAMNQGLLAAAGPIVLFLDDDIRPDPGLVAAHARAHAARPGELVAGRVLQPWHGGEADPPDRAPFGFNALEPRTVTEFMGGNFSVPRAAALSLGGFDENFVRLAPRTPGLVPGRRGVRGEAAGMFCRGYEMRSVGWLVARRFAPRQLGRAEEAVV